MENEKYIAIVRWTVMETVLNDYGSPRSKQKGTNKIHEYASMEEFENEDFGAMCDDVTSVTVLWFGSVEKQEMFITTETPMIEQIGLLQSINGKTIKLLVLRDSRKCPVTLSARPEVISHAVALIGLPVRFTVDDNGIIFKIDTHEEKKIQPWQKGKPDYRSSDKCEQKECDGGIQCFKDKGQTNACASCYCLVCRLGECSPAKRCV